MSISLSTSRSGIHAHQKAMDAIANDISNVSTTGYKSKQVNFRELMTNQLVEDRLLLADNAENTNISAGSLSGVTNSDFTQGSLTESGGTFHMAIAGNGFFGVTDPAGQFYLTRDGGFQLNGDGTLTNGRNEALVMNATLPVGAWPEGDIVIQDNGTVTIQGLNGQETQVATIPLFYPSVPDALQPAGGNNYLIPEGIELLTSNGNNDAFGKIQQGYLESSNVDLASTFTDMIVTQRAYSLNLKAAQSSDEIMGMINNFKQ
ncbi:flagellar hook basal-body protein [Desemzia sp. RIT804]|uniref:flagellar hook-basal body protein n=1 Tax=Desemzia sp. RIT 804 TaxID=2810209 RepID=UPI00194DEB4E|nr:flagellar hook basal-body protein [Desemzia sp. RIT 804]MBM6614679.1 flagellar hook basal-body protein [Desemzia sp. RIT 804]